MASTAVSTNGYGRKSAGISVYRIASFIESKPGDPGAVPRHLASSPTISACRCTGLLCRCAFFAGNACSTACLIRQLIASLLLVSSTNDAFGIIRGVASAIGHFLPVTAASRQRYYQRRTDRRVMQTHSGTNNGSGDHVATDNHKNINQNKLSLLDNQPKPLTRSWVYTASIRRFGLFHQR